MSFTPADIPRTQVFRVAAYAERYSIPLDPPGAVPLGLDSLRVADHTSRAENAASAFYDQVVSLAEIRLNSDGLAFASPAPLVCDIVERINEMRTAVPSPDFACDTRRKIGGLDEKGTP